jgi:hypothetical protein
MEVISRAETVEVKYSSELSKDIHKREMEQEGWREKHQEEYWFGEKRDPLVVVYEKETYNHITGTIVRY